MVERKVLCKWQRAIAGTTYFVTWPVLSNHLLNVLCPSPHQQQQQAFIEHLLSAKRCAEVLLMLFHLHHSHVRYLLLLFPFSR